MPCPTILNLFTKTAGATLFRIASLARQPALLRAPQTSLLRRAEGNLAAASMREDVHRIAVEGFSLQVEEYERSRPGYPPSVVATVLQQLHLQGPAHKRVLDLASGTGKFTRQLLAHSHLDVVAVDQSQEMNAELASRLPATTVLEGTATSIPADEASFDAVFSAQGFHWFATEEACREIHRVLKPGAPLCLFWNREDVAVPWIHSILAELVEPLSTGAPQYFKGLWRKPFLESDWVRKAFGIKDLQEHSKFYRHSIGITREQLWGRMLSKSYIALLPSERRDALREDLGRRLKDFDVQFAGPGNTESVPLTLEVFTAFRQD